MLIFTLNSFGQIKNFKNISKDILEQLDKMGVNDAALLNSYESMYLNAIFKDSLKGFDLTGKKVGFIYNATKSNKKEYFEQVKDRYRHNSTTISNSIYIFDDTQKVKSEGYDVAIVFWCKFIIPIENVIKKLK